jgi:hypothetical protein
MHSICIQITLDQPDSLIQEGNEQNSKSSYPGKREHKGGTELLKWNIEICSFTSLGRTFFFNCEFYEIISMNSVIYYVQYTILVVWPVVRESVMISETYDVFDVSVN